MIFNSNPCVTRCCIVGPIYSPVEGGKGESSYSTTASAPVCNFFVKDCCTKGSSCIFSHETPHHKKQPAWDESATATVAPPRPERKAATLTLRTAAAKARAADTSETSVAGSSDARIGVEEHDGASTETGTLKTDVKAKAVKILERHRWGETGYCSYMGLGTVTVPGKMRGRFCHTCRGGLCVINSPDRGFSWLRPWFYVLL